VQKLAIRAAAIHRAGHKFAARAALTVPPTETVMPTTAAHCRRWQQLDQMFRGKARREVLR